jgi:beta-glucanase (GH16 family)
MTSMMCVELFKCFSSQEPVADALEPQYTLVWTASETRFYVDGELWKEIPSNVPSVPSKFLWNNWISG